MIHVFCNDRCINHYKLNTMKIMKQILTLAFLLTTFLCSAQTNKPEIDLLPFIEVTGTAENEVIPDEIYIGIVIHERYVDRQKVSIEDQETKLKNALKSIGIDLNNLYLSDAYADYVRIRYKRNDVLTKKEYTLKVSDATTVGQVFLQLEKLDITDAYILKVNHSKMDSLRKEVRIRAIKAAKDKADYLLAAIGEQTGKPLIVNEKEIIPNLSMSNEIISAKTEETNAIEFQKIKIQTSIYVKFSIK